MKEHGIHELLESGDAVACLLDTKFESHISTRPPTAQAGVIDATDDEIARIVNILFDLIGISFLYQKNLPCPEVHSTLYTP